MIIAEAATYAISGSVIGFVIGIPMQWVTFVILITNFGGNTWSVPIATVSLLFATLQNRKLKFTSL